MRTEAGDPVWHVFRTEAAGGTTRLGSRLNRRNISVTHWGKIDRSNLRKVAGLHSHILSHSWIGHFISSKCASIFAQNAPNMSIYLSIRREYFRTALRGSGVATGQRKFLSPSGKESIEKKHRRGDCCIRQGFLAGEQRKAITTLTSYPEVLCGST